MPRASCRRPMPLRRRGGGAPSWRSISTPRPPPSCCGWRAAGSSPDGESSIANAIGETREPPSAAEDHAPENAAGEQREDPGDDERAKEQSQHGLAVTNDVVLAGEVNAERQHGQRENRQEMDRADVAPLPQLVDKERAQSHKQHQADPGVTDQPVRPRPLEAGELDEAQHECGKRGEGMNLNRERRLEQGGKRNRSTLYVGKKTRNHVGVAGDVLGRRPAQKGISSSMGLSKLALAPTPRRLLPPLPPLEAPKSPWSSSCMPTLAPPPRLSSMVSVLLKPCSTTSVE